jgi:hypothetical protein
VLARAQTGERLLGGVIVCLAHPDVPHTGAEGIAQWRRYDWLPEPEGFSYAADLAPAFGRPGVVLQDEGHAFAPYVQALAERLAYRVQVNEQAPALNRPGAVFIRSAGGLAVGAALPVADGHVIILPPLLRPENDRALVAETLFQCLERWQNRASETAQTLRKEVP